MRYIAWIAVVSGLLGASVGTVGASTTRVPLRLAAVESGGAVNLESGPKGQILGFVPHGHFELGLLLRNTSGVRLVITNVRTVEPPRTLVHQTGVRFQTPTEGKCPPGPASCPGYGYFPMGSHFGGPGPITLRPGKKVGVELDFTLGSCSQISSANPAPLSRARVTFRQPGRPASHRTLSFGAATMHLRIPKGADCRGPHSSLAVSGEAIPFNLESSTAWTIPGSKGDVCTVRNGELDFVSRKFQTNVLRTPFALGNWERIRLHLDRFSGAGTYHWAAVTLATTGREVFHWKKTVLLATRATPREVDASFKTSHRAVHGTMRCRVRG